MKNLTKHLLLLIIIFPLIILLSSVFAEKTSAQSTDCALFNNSSFFCNKQDDCIWRSTGRDAGRCDSISASANSPTPTPTIDCGGEHQFCCDGLNGSCNSGLSCDIDGVCRLSVSISTPKPTPTPTPVSKLVWRFFADCPAPTPTPIPTQAPTPTPTPAATDCIDAGGECKIFCSTRNTIDSKQCSSRFPSRLCCIPNPPTPPTPTPTIAPTPTRAPRSTDCTDSDGQCIRYNTCPVGQSSTRKTRQCGGELSSLICCISKPTPTPTDCTASDGVCKGSPPGCSANETFKFTDQCRGSFQCCIPNPSTPQPTRTPIPTKAPTAQPPTPTPTPTPKPAPAGTTPPTATPQPPATATPRPGAPTPTPTRLAGDVDGNGCISLEDFNILRFYLREQKLPDSISKHKPDLSSDGKVDIEDFAHLRLAFQTAVKTGQNLCQ